MSASGAYCLTVLRNSLVSLAPAALTDISASGPAAHRVGVIKVTHKVHVVWLEFLENLEPEVKGPFVMQGKLQIAACQIFDVHCSPLIVSHSVADAQRSVNARPLL
jgi:hypothetical protein